jgi:hypothetical protein
MSLASGAGARESTAKVLLLLSSPPKTWKKMVAKYQRKSVQCSVKYYETLSRRFLLQNFVARWSNIFLFIVKFCENSRNAENILNLGINISESNFSYCDLGQNLNFKKCFSSFSISRNANFYKIS